MTTKFVRAVVVIDDDDNDDDNNKQQKSSDFYGDVVGLSKQTSNKASSAVSLSAPVRRKSTVVRDEQSVSSSSSSSSSSGTNVPIVNASTSTATTYYCDICKFFIAQSEVQQHLRTIVHNFEQSKLTPTDRLFVLENTKGAKLLRDMGWLGGGLGPNEDGRLAPIATTIRRDRSGIGAEPKNWPHRVTHFIGEEVEGAVRPLTAAATIAKAMTHEREKKNQKKEHHLTRRQLKRKRKEEETKRSKLAHALFGDDDHKALLEGTHPSQKSLPQVKR